MNPKNIYISLFIICIMFGFAQGGPLSYGICQTGCNAVAVACYGAAGVTMGTITFGAGIAPAVMACAAAQGTCMAACVAAGLSPIP